MSFQHFRLGEMAMHQPLPPHLVHHQSTTPSISGASQQNHSSPQFTTQVIDNTNNSFSTNASKISSSSGTKQPYGSGDADDGYTLIFPNLDAFHAWREKEEESQVVEFVKGDTHGSKAVPPRFKDHTKLVCARHSRSGRKKYVKKHPERVRKVPSRKLEGQGCPASISFKTYFDTDEVRACYNSQHSHEIGPANLPFTRRGRKAAAEKDKSRKQPKFASDDSRPATPAPAPESSPVPQPPPASYSSAISMIAPLPPTQPSYQPAPQYTYRAQYPYTPPAPPPQAGDGFSQDRWQNMETLFNSVRQHARTFTYPTASVAALETVLIRLFLESPSPPGISIMNPQPIPAPVPQTNVVTMPMDEDSGSDVST